MTEDVIDSGMDQSQDVVTQDAGIAQQDAPSQPNYADMVSKQRVNEIVQERTRQAAEKAYQRGLSESAQKSQTQSSSSMGGMYQPSEDQLRQMMEQTFESRYAKLQDDFQRSETEKQINKIAQDFMGKIDAGKDKYPDLVKRQNEIGELGTLIPFINESEHTAGLANHLINNGHTVASLLVLQHTSPVFLRREIQKIANSLKQNEDAVNAPRAHEPLYQPTPSTYTTDGGSDSIEALKQQPWLRG